MENMLEFQFGNKKTVLTFTGEKDIWTVKQAHRILGVVDDAVFRLYGEIVSSFPGDIQLLSAGEEEKSWQSIRIILSRAVEAGLGRDSLFVGIGGGVVCDTAAFAASLYNRGCRIILVPTTLLAMVDAALGGKTGINFSGYKNLVGTFYPAEEVRLCLSFLKKLPEAEYRSGMAEVIKSALLGDEKLAESLETNRDGWMRRDPDILQEGIFRCLKVKGRFVTEDPEEGGTRAFLNFGHTFGHALESVSGLGELSHGEAVAWGMVMALRAGEMLGITDPYYRSFGENLIKSYGFETSLQIRDIETFTEALKRDKKNRDGQVRFILQRNLKDTLLTPLDLEFVRDLVS
jgi:3-dehydroquinate synthase